MRVELSARALAVSKIGQPDGVGFQHEDVVADSGVAAGRPHRAGKPCIDDLEVVWARQGKKSTPDVRRSRSMPPTITQRL